MKNFFVGSFYLLTVLVVGALKGLLPSALVWAVFRYALPPSPLSFWQWFAIGAAAMLLVDFVTGRLGATWSAMFTEYKKLSAIAGRIARNK